MIERMRLDFPLAAKAEGWSVEDQDEVGAAIRAAVAAGDQETLAYWAKRLADGAAQWRAWCARVRQAEASARAAAREARAD